MTKLGKSRGKERSDFDPLKNTILLFGSQSTVQSFIKTERELRPYEMSQTDRRTDAGFCIICPMQCYSDGTAKNSCSARSDVSLIGRI